MRFPALLMALHLVFLALFPCQDLPAVTSGEATISGVPMDQDEPTHDDDCTPLCSCACCGTLVTGLARADVPEEMSPLPPSGRTHPDHIPSWNPLLAEVSLAQPPRS